MVGVVLHLTLPIMNLEQQPPSQNKNTSCANAKESIKSFFFWSKYQKTNTTTHLFYTTTYLFYAII